VLSSGCLVLRLWIFGCVVERVENTLVTAEQSVSLFHSLSLFDIVEPISELIPAVSPM
jgi:hypothetical protein